jgi:AcrR family transcriptional regulator
MEVPAKIEPRWERRKDARPGELLAAALDLFVEKGYTATRLDDVAARAGVSKGTLYLYFDNKEALFKAVVQEGLVPVIEEGETLIRDYQGSAAELLRHIVKRWWESIGATHFAGVIKLMISEAQNFPEVARFHHDQVVVRGKRIFAYAVELGVRQGEFRPVATDHCVRILLAPLMMLAIWRYSLGVCETEPVDPASYIDTYLDMALAGLVPRGKP